MISPLKQKTHGRPRTKPLPPMKPAMRKGGKYDPTRHPIDYYILATARRTPAQIAKAFQIRPDLLSIWLRKPEMAYAKECAEAVEVGYDVKKTFLKELTPELPPSLQPIWERILHWGETMDFTEIAQMTRDLSTQEKQCLFCMAYCHDRGNFTISGACDMIGISTFTAAHWQKHDPQFVAMFEQLKLRKGDFWESALMNLGRAGNWAVILHANKTLNRDRGYGEKLEVEHKGRIEHEHTTPLRAIMDRLSPEALQEVVSAIRELKAAEAKPVEGGPPALPMASSRRRDVSRRSVGPVEIEAADLGEEG